MNTDEYDNIAAKADMSALHGDAPTPTPETDRKAAPVTEQTGIRVNLSDEEAQSQDREPLPQGKFHYKITDMELMFVKEGSKNAGKPYLNLEFTVQDGKYASRKDWTNAMCFEGALYTISQILKALGHPINVGPDGKAKGGELIIPDAREFYVGKDIWGRRGTNKNDKNDDGSLRIQLRGFSKYEGGTSDSPASTPAAVKQPASVLP
jgi:hypothetical protein